MGRVRTVSERDDAIRRLRAEILQRTEELTRLKATEHEFRAGVDPVPYAGRVYDAREVVAGVSSMLDFWLTLGPDGEAFEEQLRGLLGVRQTRLVNSGSSANLLAFASLTSWKLGDEAIRPGDEVITAAAGFPTTVAPIVQLGAVPVFVDSDVHTGNLRVDQLEDAFIPGKTRAVMMAHTLGNPFDVDEVVRFCRERDLWLVEDNCDALGSRYDARLTGTFGDLSTQSFYPPHHITMGEGGAVNVVSDPRLTRLVESFRDWGRDCWCASGKDNTCEKRFAWQLGDLPQGYDHKYVYAHLGYNLKPTDPQAAIGRVQLTKLAEFGDARRRNWHWLRRRLAPLEDVVDFMLPTHATSWSVQGFSWAPGKPEVDPSWFGFLMVLREDSPISRAALARVLDKARVGSRMLFGGNLVRQPAFAELARSRAGSFRVVGDLRGADRLMRDALFVGVYPGLSEAQLEHVATTILTALRPGSA